MGQMVYVLGVGRKPPYNTYFSAFFHFLQDIYKTEVTSAFFNPKLFIYK